MKRILILPLKITGIVDIRQQDYYIINDVSYLEQIQSYLIKKGKSFKDYKFCQFENATIIPYFVNIKDRLSNNAFQEFEIENVKFDNLPVDEKIKKQAIEQRHIGPLNNKMQDIVLKTSFLIASEKLGDKIDEEKFINLKLEKEKLDKEIQEFNWKDYLNEIV